ncbi:hypothetical protein [Methylobacterium sp. V23]|uniref:hypothetical protein n=1 Tax=Methylobacterium sp. V23 TaxID=2044878 RepID=UPI000CDADC20|nr:hypothetical protein [Methylobacterium sp. V23]POR40190.1 hypothetical protein CRT23_25255 [Methylobacterium sp. V23]
MSSRDVVADGAAADAAAAHELLCELRTRISTQPLPYQYGVEARALESLWEVFAQARAAMKNNPGCERFAQATTDMLNVDLRPVTAKWHRAHADGRLASRDGADAFRADLADVQLKLNTFANALHMMAYGTERNDALTPPVFSEDGLLELMADLPFGLAADKQIPAHIAAQISAAETAAIRLRRGEAKTKAPPVNAVGLGLSGGGIRSASFCLGVIQVLADRKLLRDVDYLSTVSGGGYVGAFLTRQLDDPAGESAVAAPHGPDTDAVRYLRQHAKYLSADHLKERWAMVVAGLAGMVLNWTAPLFLVALSAFVLLAAGPALSVVPWRWVFFFVGAGLFLGVVVQAVSLRRHERDSPLLAWVVLLAAAVAVLALIVWALHLEGIRWTTNVTVAGVAAAAAAAAPTLLRFLPVLRKTATRNALLKAALVLGGIAVPVGAVLATYGLWRLGHVDADADALLFDPRRYGGPGLLGLLIIALGLIAFVLLDINLTGPHRLYRDRLARTFVRRDPNDANDVDLAATNATGHAPYHLINAAADLPAGTSPALRERRSDFFLFSKAWCGSPSIGYWPTSEWRAGRRGMDLATAMAISGAAVSPQMGLGSIPSLSSLLSFLNVRLNYWIRRPGATTLFAVPGFACLLREMTGVGMSETAAWLSLSDGGHIENLGIYELLRRRCKFIISVDGEADPLSTFQGHLTLVRHAQIDFGIRMEPDLRDLRPDLTTRFSQTHAMMVHVRYPKTATQEAGDGLILYLKLSVTGNEAEIIKRYRLLQPDFPHQTTLDQFFDEEQFEAYRQLGVHVAEGLFSPALVPGDGHPPNVKTWFGSLAAQMLEPDLAAVSPRAVPEDVEKLE